MPCARCKYGHVLTNKCAKCPAPICADCPGAKYCYAHIGCEVHDAIARGLTLAQICSEYFARLNCAVMWGNRVVKILRFCDDMDYVETDHGEIFIDDLTFAGDHLFLIEVAYYKFTKCMSMSVDEFFNKNNFVYKGEHMRIMVRHNKKITRISRFMGGSFVRVLSPDCITDDIALDLYMALKI